MLIVVKKSHKIISKIIVVFAKIYWNKKVYASIPDVVSVHSFVWCYAPKINSNSGEIIPKHSKNSNIKDMNKPKRKKCRILWLNFVFPLCISSRKNVIYTNKHFWIFYIILAGFGEISYLQIFEWALGNLIRRWMTSWLFEVFN